MDVQQSGKGGLAMRAHRLLAICAAVVSTLALQNGALAQTLVAHYPFSGDANDASGNGHHGTVSGPQLASDRFGIPNAAYSFNGNAGYTGTDIIGVLDAASLRLTSQLTVAAWVKPTVLGSPTPEVLAKFEVGQTPSYRLTLRDDGEVIFQLASTRVASNGDATPQAGATTPYGVGSFGLANDVWTHIAVTFDDATDRVTFNKNGQLVSVILTPAHIPSSLARLSIGGFFGNGTSYCGYNGLIDDVRIYSSVLSATEVGAVAAVPDLQIAGKMLLSSLRDGKSELYTMNPDGTGATWLTNDPRYDHPARWSPDGTQLTWWTDRDGNWEIYVMNADGSSPTRLTNTAALEMYPVWSPDGTRIAYSIYGGGNDYDIYIMNANGTGQARLTSNASGYMPSWSPDGTRIAYQAYRNGNWDIYTVDAADGSNEVRLTTTAAQDSDPRWSPDGTKILFISMRDDPVYGDFFVMSADGSNQTRIMSSPAEDR